MKKTFMLLSTTIFLIIFQILFYVVGNKTYNTISLFLSLNKTIFILLFFILSNSFILYTLLSSHIQVKFHKGLAYFTGYCFSIFIYLLIYFIIASLLNVIFKKTQFNFNIIALALVPITLIVGTYMAQSTHIKKYDIKLNKELTSNLKIVLVSDIHLGDIMDKPRLNKMISEINSLSPDVILIAGDLIDSDLNVVLDKNLLPSLKNLKSTYGTYFSLGNHDYYTKQYNKLTNILKEYNIKTLQNESILINDCFYIIGRNDTSFNENIKLKHIIKNINLSKPIIVMDHTPNRINESICNNIDLQVSGHTHNGQIFPGNIITSLIYKNGNGYKKFQNTNVVVSSGYGTWGPPIRTTGKAQIVLINMHN